MEVLDNLDSVPEEYRGFYEQIADGDDKGKFRLQDITSLKNALNYERTENKTNKAIAKKVKDWEKIGKTPEEITELLNAMATAEEEEARKKGDHESILQQKTTAWNKEKDTLTGQVDKWRGAYQNVLVETNLSNELVKAGVTEEGLELLPGRLCARVSASLNDEDKVITRILAADGQTPMAGSGSDGSATFEDLVKEAKQKFPSLFKGSGGSGSGASPTGPAGAGKKRSTMTVPEKTAYIREHGHDAYNSLPM